jgi:hypothetical protein
MISCKFFIKKEKAAFTIRVHQTVAVEKEGVLKALKSSSGTQKAFCHPSDQQRASQTVFISILKMEMWLGMVTI